MKLPRSLQRAQYRQDGHGIVIASPAHPLKAQFRQSRRRCRIVGAVAKNAVPSSRERNCYDERNLGAAAVNRVLNGKQGGTITKFRHRYSRWHYDALLLYGELGTILV